MAAEKPTHQLNAAGQSLWLDNISRGLLASGRLRQYRDELSVTGLTSNPSIFDEAIRRGSDYDTAIGQAPAGADDEQVFFDLALQDLRGAAQIFADIHTRTQGVDGWVSLELSPLLADDTAASIAQARKLHAAASLPNLYIKIPGTPAGVPAIEESIFAGIPVNVTLLFSREQYQAAAEAYVRGIERRVAAGLDPRVESVASVFVSRWDRAVTGKVPDELHNRLGIAIAQRVYASARALFNTDRWMRLQNLGARPQRVLWGSTGSKDPKAPDTLYISALAAPFTVNTMPEATLLAFADHGALTALLPADGGDCEAVLARFASAGVDVAALALRLQQEGAEAFVKSWNELIGCIRERRAALRPGG
ncbi:MAG: transaldolase [Steroidobacteraceae bacterium]